MFGRIPITTVDLAQQASRRGLSQLFNRDLAPRTWTRQPPDNKRPWRRVDRSWRNSSSPARPNTPTASTKVNAISSLQLRKGLRLIRLWIRMPQSAPSRKGRAYSTWATTTPSINQTNHTITPSTTHSIARIYKSIRKIKSSLFLCQRSNPSQKPP